MTDTTTSKQKPEPLDESFGFSIGGSGSAAYKSIDHVEWRNIPKLAVITGVNGSGKSQLLELLAHKLANVSAFNSAQVGHVKLKIHGADLSPADVAYSPARSEVSNASSDVASLQNAKRQLWDSVRQAHHHDDMRRKITQSKLEEFFGTTNLESIGVERFVKELPDDYCFMLDNTEVTAGLCHVFVAYRLNFLEELEKARDVDKATAKMGPPPWEVVNAILSSAGLPYKVPAMQSRTLKEAYHLLLIDEERDVTVNPNDLSSGEKMLLRLALWLYNAGHQIRLPRLFLLDEPDAHLHPSMTRQFMDVVNSVLVERYKITVIMTTHSPSTVALAPEGSIFEMSRTEPRIRQSSSRAHSIGLLTAGLITVTSGTKFVLVEDVSDVDAYDAIYSVLTDYGPSKDAQALEPSPSLVFLPASTGSGGSKISGGKTVVTGWVEKFDQEPLSQIVKGLIDRDCGNSATARVQVLARYSIENYLLDPPMLYGVLSERGVAPVIGGVSISSGDEHLIRALSADGIQKIVAEMRARVEPKLSNVGARDTTEHVVEFTNGTKVKYPGWMLFQRGHDLLAAYQSEFGGFVTPPNLIKSFLRVRLVPIELPAIFRRLQA